MLCKMSRGWVGCENNRAAHCGTGARGGWGMDWQTGAMVNYQPSFV
jgi:hypothetical protein